MIYLKCAVVWAAAIAAPRSDIEVAGGTACAMAELVYLRVILRFGAVDFSLAHCANLG